MLRLWLALWLLPGSLWAAPPPSIVSIKADPTTIVAHTPTPVVFSAQLSNNPARVPKEVRLTRLQGTGAEKPVAKLRDDGERGDLVKNDGLYTTRLNLKEPIAGILSFRVEVIYPNDPLPVRSRPIFITITGESKE